MGKPELYRELVYKLGDTAYERLWNKPNAPRAIERVIRAAEVLEKRQVELAAIETAMNEEEASYAEFKQACDEETAQCQELIQKYKKLVQAAESKARSLEAAMVSKRNDARIARQGLAKFEAQIKEAEE
ncbi:MAG: hypothetical protein ACK4N5_11250, partial [Myxococcales bacterium]